MGCCGRLVNETESDFRIIPKLNQISSGGLTYDANRNMTNDGTNAYTWDRANRLLSMGGHDYTYDGMGNRVSQLAAGVTTRYLLDQQPGLVQVLRATKSGGIILDPNQSYVHGPRGIHAEIGGMDVVWVHAAIRPVRCRVRNGSGSHALRCRQRGTTCILDGIEMASAFYGKSKVAIVK